MRTSTRNNVYDMFKTGGNRTVKSIIEDLLSERFDSAFSRLKLTYIIALGPSNKPTDRRTPKVPKTPKLGPRPCGYRFSNTFVLNLITFHVVISIMMFAYRYAMPCHAQMNEVNF